MRKASSNIDPWCIKGDFNSIRRDCERQREGRNDARVGDSILGYLYREMCSATNYTTKSIGGMCILLQMWT